MTLTTEPAVTLALPRRWTTRDDPAPGVVLLARAPSPTAAGLIPELVLRTGPIGDDTGINITVVGYDDDLHVTVVGNPVTVERPEELVEGFHLALEELIACTA